MPRRVHVDSQWVNAPQVAALIEELSGESIIADTANDAEHPFPAVVTAGAHSQRSAKDDPLDKNARPALPPKALLQRDQAARTSQPFRKVIRNHRAVVILATSCSRLPELPELSSRARTFNDLDLSNGL